MLGMPRKKKPSDATDYRRKKGWIPPKGVKPRGRPRKSPATAAPVKSPPSTPAKKPPASKVPPKPPTPAPAPRGRPRKLPPTLAELAGQFAPHLDGVKGGTCENCDAPCGDNDRCCTACGTPVRNECSKCGTAMRDGMAFCKECGTPAAAKPAAAPVAADAPPVVALTPSQSPPPPVERWEGEDMFIVSSCVELVIARLAGEKADECEMSDKQKDRINDRAAVVANKHFIIGGKWKEEIALGMAIAGAIFPAAYIGFVEIPREKRRAERERIKALEAEAAAARSRRDTLRVVPNTPPPAPMPEQQL